MNRKDLLFYSINCSYSKKIIELLVKNNIRDQFVLVCVDNKALTIPKFVNRVPMVLTTFKEIYADGYVLNYIESILSKQQGQSGPPQSSDDIAPFVLQNVSQYTYITNDGDGYDNNKSDDNVYGILGMEQQISNGAAGSGSYNSEKTSKMDSSLFEKYINSRKSDDDAIKKMFNPNRI